MTKQNKKTTNKAPKNTATKAAKSGNNTAQAAKKTAEAAKPKLSAIESNVRTADQFAHAGAETAKDFLAGGADRAREQQEEVLAFSRDYLKNWTQSADQTSEALHEAFKLGQENIDAAVESGKIASDLGKEFHEQLVKEVNELFAENIESAKELLACRTVQDYLDLQQRSWQSNFGHLVNQSTRWTDLWFRLTTDASEPLNTQTSKAASRLKNNLAA